MSSAARSLSRLSLQTTRQITAKRKSRCPNWRKPVNRLRTFSTAPSWLAEENDASNNNTASEGKNEGVLSTPTTYITIDDLEDDSRAQFDRATSEEQAEWRTALRTLSELDHTAPFKDELAAMEPDLALEAARIHREAPISFPEYKPTKMTAGFWADEEDDEFGQVFDDDDEFLGDDITTPAHAQLDLHRDMRAYQRRIAWDMPLLSKFAKPYTPPQLTSPLRFRYTTYMGEQHPAASKVVLEVCPKDLPSTLLSTPQQHNKLIKLAGVRYNPDKGVIKMSCEKFETPAQNKRYLGDLINKLIDEARDPEADSFEDVPFDFRHHKPKKRVTFPDAWRLGDADKVKGLVEAREKRRLLAEAKTVINGDGVVKQYAEVVAAFQARQQLGQPVLAGSAQGRKQLVR